MRAIFVPTLKEAESIFGDINSRPYKYGIIQGSYKGTPVFITSATKTPAAFCASVVLRDEGFTEAVLTGICGAYKWSGLKVGDVVCVHKDYFADEALFFNDSIVTLNDMGFGFINGNCAVYSTLNNIPITNSNTVSYLDGEGEVSELLYEKTLSGIENMEGAAFGYVCNTLNIKAFQIRAVSNFCGKRDEQKWNIKLAFANLKSFFEYECKN